MSVKRRVAIALQINNPYPQHQELFTGIQRYVRENPGWEYVIDEHPGYKPGHRSELFGRYDGVIARSSQRMQRRLKKMGIPLVNTWLEHARPGLPGVYPDCEAFARLAIEHLVERGFHRLCFLTQTEYVYIQLYKEAFGRYAEEHGSECRMCEVPDIDLDDPESWLTLEKRLSEWMDGLTLPVGLLVQEPTLARLVVAMCSSRGWLVPQDIAILCQQNAQVIMENPPPKLTSIDRNYERIGYEAAALLDRLMDGEPPPQKPLLIPPRGVVARESTDFFAVEDEVVAEALRYISTHLRDRLKLDRIAHELAVSPRTLQMRFDAALGRPISDEIRRQRLGKAKRLLGEKEMQISRIAREAGFGTHNQMSDVFGRELGMTPSEYREQVLGEREK